MTIEKPPLFFLPKIAGFEIADAEAEYARLAKLCGVFAPPIGQRIYSIVYLHDGDRWTATVGKQLEGIRRKVIHHRKSRTKTEHDIPLSDCAVVVAIFPGAPHVVVTDGCRIHGGRSHWGNPFLAGDPGVTYFSH